jgi:hypothetical protein
MLPLNPSSNTAPPATDTVITPLQTSLRRDRATEKAVEIGIRLQDVLGTRDAARFLKNNVVDIEIALRVLLHPAQRRRI